VTNALPLYTLLFEYGLFSNAIVPFDDLYIKILRNSYGHQASEVHPFILMNQNPLYLLVQLNIVLLGSPVIGMEMIGRVRYLQKSRTVCAIVASEGLGRALDRTTLATSNQNRQSALLVQTAAPFQLVCREPTIEVIRNVALHHYTKTTKKVRMIER
jgi:hypothetical protein